VTVSANASTAHGAADSGKRARARLPIFKMFT